MRKIPTLLRRDPENLRTVLGEITPGCEWVLWAVGVPTRKWDGTCVMLDAAGAWWARREVKGGRPAPDGWVASDYDPKTGNRPGWEPIEQSPYAKFHGEAVAAMHASPEPGTYELCGPKINGNPEGCEHHVLVPHDENVAGENHVGMLCGLPGPLPGEDLRAWGAMLMEQIKPYEGIVWHHPDGRMAKLKVRDFPELNS